MNTKENWRYRWRRPFWNLLPRDYAYNYPYAYPSEQRVIVVKDNNTNKLSKNNAILQAENKKDNYLMFSIIGFIMLIVLLIFIKFLFVNNK